MAQVLFVYILVVFYLSKGLYSSELMRALWDEDLPLKRVLLGESESEEQTNRIVNRLSELPFSEQLKTDAWHKLLQYRSVENFAQADWERMESLIPYLPSQYLNAVNFSDEIILHYFGRLKLKHKQLLHVAEAVKARLGFDVLQNENHTLKMGNILCGFSEYDLSSISKDVLGALMKENIFQGITGCTNEQLKILIRKVQDFNKLGPPRHWKPNTVKLAGNLIAALNASQIRTISRESFAHVSPETIKLMSLDTLKNLRKDQLTVLNRHSLLAWRRKTQDLTPLHAGSVTSFYPNVTLLGLIILCLSINCGGGTLKEKYQGRVITFSRVVLVRILQKFLSLRNDDTLA